MGDLDRATPNMTRAQALYSLLATLEQWPDWAAEAPVPPSGWRWADKPVHCPGQPDFTMPDLRPVSGDEKSISIQHWTAL